MRDQVFAAMERAAENQYEERSSDPVQIAIEICDQDVEFEGIEPESIAPHVLAWQRTKLYPSQRVMVSGGYGVSIYELPGALMMSHPGHISDPRGCGHETPCQYWSVRLDTGSVHFYYPSQITPLPL